MHTNARGGVGAVMLVVEEVVSACWSIHDTLDDVASQGNDGAEAEESVVAAAAAVAMALSSALSSSWALAGERVE